MTEKKVVTSFIRHQDKILLLRRSGKVGSYQGKWAGVSGFLEETSPIKQALKEIHEETGLAGSDVKFIAAGKVLEVLDRELEVRWLVHPFLFETSVPEKIKLDWEHIEMQWVEPAMLQQLPTVPQLAEAYRQCLSGKENDNAG